MLLATAVFLFFLKRKTLNFVSDSPSQAAGKGQLISKGLFVSSFRPKTNEFFLRISARVELLKAVLHGYAGGLIFMK